MKSALRRVGGVTLKKLACAVPGKKVSLQERLAGVTDAKEVRRLAAGTGFQEFRIADRGLTTSDLCAAAAEKVLAHIDRNTVRNLVFVTQTPDYSIPATSHILQERLHLPTGTVCLDINEGCSGWVHGLYLSALLQAEESSGGGTLLLAGDTISQLTSETDTSTQCIFGDAGSATLLTTEGDGELLFAMSSLGEKAKAIMVPNSRHRLSGPKERDGKLYMDGEAVMNFTLGDVPTIIRELLDYSGTEPEEIDLYACHQANQLILRFLAKKLKVSESRMPFAAGKIGNTSSASIPLVLASRLEKSHARTILCGFGVGLAVSACQADMRGLEYLGTVEL